MTAMESAMTDMERGGGGYGKAITGIEISMMECAMTPNNASLRGTKQSVAFALLVLLR